MCQTWPLYVYLHSFLNTMKSIVQQIINRKSIDGVLQIQTLDNRMEGADENKERLFHSKLFFETKCVKFRSETDSQESLRRILFLKVEIGDTKDAHFENTSQCIIFHLSLSLSLFFFFPISFSIFLSLIFSHFLSPSLFFLFCLDKSSLG